MSDMNEMIDKIIGKINDSNNSSNVPMIILQCITIVIILLKPIFMYWIQAKYKADPPHESIRDANHDSDEVVKTFQMEQTLTDDDTNKSEYATV